MSSTSTNQTVLRSERERMQFCKAYFSSVKAQLNRESDSYLEYVLPPDVDKEIMDRPFYWLWVEKTNQKIKLTTLRLAFTHEAQKREDALLKQEHDKQLALHPPLTPYERMFARPAKTEMISLGCLRFEKILESASQRGKFASVSPHSSRAPSQELVPWFLVCANVSYQSDSLQQFNVSIGICLENNQVVFNFYDKIKHIPMVPTPVSEVTKRARILPKEAIDLYQQTIQEHIMNQPHDWAQEARVRLEDDLSQLDTYYMSVERECDEKTREAVQAEHARKREDMIKKGAPRIHVAWTQFAFVGLPLRTSNLS